MCKIDDATLMECVTVWCSKDECKFKKNTDYYNICHNRCTLLNNMEFAGGRLYVSGCGFSNCDDECKIVLEDKKNDS